MLPGGVEMWSILECTVQLYPPLGDHELRMGTQCMCGTGYWDPGEWTESYQVMDKTSTLSPKLKV